MLNVSYHTSGAPDLVIRVRQTHTPATGKYAVLEIGEVTFWPSDAQLERLARELGLYLAGVSVHLRCEHCGVILDGQEDICVARGVSLCRECCRRALSVEPPPF